MELSALCGLWCKCRATFYGYRLIAFLLLLASKVFGCSTVAMIIGDIDLRRSYLKVTELIHL
jgi:hypothetical protein